MAERADVHVEGSPSRCPWCRDDLAELREVVACAACGARHHDECHREHGRCASCGGVERLVFAAPAAAIDGPPGTEPWLRVGGMAVMGLAGLVAAAAVAAQAAEWSPVLLGFSLAVAGLLFVLGAALVLPGPAPRRPERR